MKKIYDIAIVGGGISGLSASISSASEGYSTILLESDVNFGGQAGTASLIENFIGFPNGVTGLELTKRSIEQANKFGVKFKSPFKVINMKRENNIFHLASSKGDIIKSKIVVLTMGMIYNKLENSSINKFLGKGVYYGSPSLSETICDNVVTVVGGANSAGQACVYLSGCVGCSVNLIVRADSLEKGMSHYLIKKIRATPNIKVFLNSEIAQFEGGCDLDRIILISGETVYTQKLYILIGSKPKTSWLGKDADLDVYGYIRTDDDLRVSEGLFSAGDVRAGSIKRVVCASGEGGSIMRGVNKDFEKINNSLTISSK